MHLRVTLVVALVVALGLAAPAIAQQVNAPPGNSAVDEYLETVPEAGGNQPTNSNNGRTPLPAAARRALERSGPDGQAAADLAERGGADAAPQRQPPATAVTPRAAGSGVVDPLRRAAGGSDEGMGLMLPILLAAGAIGAVMAVLWRRRISRQ